MTPLQIFQLLIAFGPPALGLIQKLAAIWTKPVLTLEEVNEFCNLAKNDYDFYVAAALASLTPSLTLKVATK